MSIARIIPSFRMQFRFWLDVEREEEHAIAEYIERLKEARMFASTIRDAFRLIFDLRLGRVNVLLALFPWIEEYFREKYQQPRQDISGQLAELRGLLQSGALVVTSEKQASRNFQLPTSLEDPEIALAKAAPGNSVYNALLSAAALNDNLDNLPDEVLLYALDCGKLRRTQLSKSTLARFDLAMQPMAIKQIAGSGKALPDPVFED